MGVSANLFLYLSPGLGAGMKPQKPGKWRDPPSYPVALLLLGTAPFAGLLWPLLVFSRGLGEGLPNFQALLITCSLRRAVGEGGAQRSWDEDSTGGVSPH